MGGAACDWGDQFASAAGYRGLAPASPPPHGAPPQAQAPASPRPPDVVIGVGSPEGATSSAPPTRRATTDGGGVASKPPTLAACDAPPPSTPAATPQYDWEQDLLADLLHGDRRGATGWMAGCRRAARRYGRTVAATAVAAATTAALAAAAPHARLLGVHAWRYAMLAAATPLIWVAADRAVAAGLAAADGRVAWSTAALLALASARGPAVRLARAAGLAAAFGAVVADYDGVSDGAVQHAALATAAKLLACVSFAAAASLAARVAAAWFAASLYARAHADRVRDALDKEYILWALSQPRRSTRGGGDARPPPPPVDTPLLASATQPATPALARVPTGTALAALEAHVREHRLASPLADALGAVRPPPPSTGGATPTGPPTHLTDADDARALALYLFWHVRGSAVGRGHLEKSDLTPFLDAPIADAAWRLLDPASTGRATPAALRHAVTSIHTQRVQLAAALADARASASSLEAALAALAHATALLAYCAVFGVDAGRALLTASSTLVATAFIFGNTLRGVFESAAFVYGVHAFDVGDVLLIDGVWHQVRRGETDRQPRHACCSLTHHPPTLHPRSSAPPSSTPASNAGTASACGTPTPASPPIPSPTCLALRRAGRGCA